MTATEPMPALSQIRRLIRADLKAAADTLSLREVRFIVDTYYAVQKFRLSSGNQKGALEKSGEPHELITFAFETFEDVEGTIRAAMDRYTQVESTGMGLWARNIRGIGPVLSAGLLGNRLFSAEQPAISHAWSFAGLNPNAVWKKNEKRPWNQKLKLLCFKIGDSFIKFKGRTDCVYGHVYEHRKALEVMRNERGDFQDQAADKLRRFDIGKNTIAYQWYNKGMLPPGRILARARRYAVKLFIAHYWEEFYRRTHGKEPPKPYPIDILGHAHYIESPDHVPYYLDNISKGAFDEAVSADYDDREILSEGNIDLDTDEPD